MIRKVIFISGLLLLLAAGAFFIWKSFIGETDEDVIRRRLNEVTSCFGKVGKEGFLVQLEQARKIAKYFDEVCDVRLPKFHREAKMNRDNITQNTVTVRQLANTLELSVYDLEFFFPAEGERTRCRLLFTGMVNAEFRSGDRFREAYDLEMTWVKKEGEWLIDGVGFSGILQR